MKRAVGLGVLVLLPCTMALASDWKYAGYLDTPGLGGSLAFYDSDAVKREGTRVRYWIKLIPRKVLDSVGETRDKKKRREFIHAAASKVAAGYIPPLLTVPSFRQVHQQQGLKDDFEDLRVTVVAWEVAANTGVRHASLLLFEIDCSQTMIRTLDVSLFDKNGRLKKRSGTVKEDWEFIAPDTNAAWISEVVCRL